MPEFRTGVVCCLSLIGLLAFLGVGCRVVWAEANVWTSTGPFGGNVQALAIDPQNPTTIYAGTFNGLFKSTDSGANWTLVKTRLSNGFIAFLATDPQNPATVYVGNREAALKSTDGGNTWSDFGPTASSVRFLAFDGQDSAIIYALTASGDIFKSTDGGVTWNYSGLLGIPIVYILVVDPQTPSTIYAGTFNGLFKSTDSWANWSSGGLPHSYPVFSVAVDPQNPSTLYATDSAGVDGGIFKSVNGGTSWSPVNSGLPLGGPLNLNPGGIGLLVIDPHKPSILY